MERLRQRSRLLTSHRKHKVVSWKFAHRVSAAHTASPHGSASTPASLLVAVVDVELQAANSRARSSWKVRAHAIGFVDSHFARVEAATRVTLRTVLDRTREDG